MTVDLRDSVDKWKSHFQSMAHGKIPVENVYFLNQKGKGLGTNPKGRALYKIQSGGQSISSSVNSPANKGYAMAIGRIKNIEKRSKSRKNKGTKASKNKTITGIKRRNNKGKIRKVTKHPRRKISAKQKPKKTSKRKRVGKRKTVRRIIKDVFK